MSVYQASWPSDQSGSTKIPDFFAEFYKISDTPGATDEYANAFTKNATLMMVSKKVEGRDGK